MTKFKLGERITFLNEKGYGIIQEILDGDRLKIEDEHGFTQIYKTESIVKIEGAFDSDFTPVYKDDEQVESRSNFTIIKEKSIENLKDYWELDLHIESLTENFRGMSNFEILKKQMTEFKRFFSKAKSNSIRKIVVIHGVGEGILKNEIRDFLSNQEFVTHYDASYLEYGKGATEIIIQYS